MATKIKTTTIQEQIDFVDTIAKSAGVDLRQMAQKAIYEREAKRMLGVAIVNGIGLFNRKTGEFVVVIKKA